MKNCIACGMPMRSKDDFPNQDQSKAYCKYCANSDGSMKNFIQKVEDTTNFLIQTQGLDKNIGRKTAINQLKKLPLWQNERI